MIRGQFLDVSVDVGGQVHHGTHVAVLLGGVHRGNGGFDLESPVRECLHHMIAHRIGVLPLEGEDRHLACGGSGLRHIGLGLAPGRSASRPPGLVLCLGVTLRPAGRSLDRRNRAHDRSQGNQRQQELVQREPRRLAWARGGNERGGRTADA